MAAMEAALRSIPILTVHLHGLNGAPTLARNATGLNVNVHLMNNLQTDQLLDTLDRCVAYGRLRVIGFHSLCVRGMLVSGKLSRLAECLRSGDVAVSFTDHCLRDPMMIALVRMLLASNPGQKVFIDLRHVTDASSELGGHMLWRHFEHHHSADQDQDSRSPRVVLVADELGLQYHNAPHLPTYAQALAELAETDPEVHAMWALVMMPTCLCL